MGARTRPVLCLCVILMWGLCGAAEKAPTDDVTLADLRFQPDDPDLPVERFMRDYYRIARTIKSHSELVIDQCARRGSPERS